VNDLLTVSQVALILKMSEASAARLMARLPGVINLADNLGSRFKQRYRIYRLPKAELERHLSKKAGKPVFITVPDVPLRARAHDGWKDSAALRLAKMAKQNKCADRKVLERIAGKAYMLAKFVPETEWSEVLAGWLLPESDSDEDESDEVPE